tara:strand:+ start:3247 stop:3603 length:357 start_codon:yes stop_codon:yes gene_type:complete
MRESRPDEVKKGTPTNDTREVTAAEAQAAISSPLPIEFLTQEISAYVGDEILKGLTRSQIENYCMQSIHRDEPTGKVLLTLMQNFIIAYGDSRTSEEAMKAYDFLTYLSHPTDDPDFP